MPLHYGSQIEEHHRVRRDAGMFDVSHMLAVDVDGEGARDVPAQLLANNVDRLQLPGKALYSCMLNDAGGILDDLIVYFLDATTLSHGRQRRHRRQGPGLDVWRKATRLRRVTITPRRDLAMIAVQGPAARAKVWQALPAYEAGDRDAGAVSSLRSRRHISSPAPATPARTASRSCSRPPHALSLWQALLDAGVAPAGLGARDTLRLEAGMNLYGQDMDETVTPLECGLAWTVDLKARATSSARRRCWPRRRAADARAWC